MQTFRPFCAFEPRPERTVFENDLLWTWNIDESHTTEVQRLLSVERNDCGICGDVAEIVQKETRTGGVSCSGRSSQGARVADLSS